MEEEKFSILNDNDLEIKGLIIRPKRTGKFPLVVFAHDVLDTGDSASIKEFARLFLEQGYSVVRFDFTNGFGKSTGRSENVTISQQSRDLELVVEYVKRRSYVNDAKVIIIGFGFGAMSTLVLEGFHALAKAIVLVNIPSQVDDTAWSRFDEREMVRVKLKRYFHLMRNNEEVRINYTFFEDGYRQDLFRCARNLRTPTLYLAGKDDVVVAPLHSERLAERTNGKKELIIVPGIGHELGKKQIALFYEQMLSFFKRQRIN